MTLPKTPKLSNPRDRGGSVEFRLINCPPFAIFGRVGSSFADARPFFATAGRDLPATQAVLQDLIEEVGSLLIE